MKRGILGSKVFLYSTEFFAGMSVMAVELCASRLLAPYFSSSQIVWTIIISTIMIAMALGNVYGGRTADRDANPDRLYRRFLIAAVWIAAIPFAGRYLILLVTGILVVAVSGSFLVIAAFLACLIIFVFPCFLLGTCTPTLARCIVTGADDSGRTVGALGAFNTAGSIIGTFLPTFVTIPTVGTAATFIIFAGILLALALIYFISARKGAARCAAAMILMAAAAIPGYRGRFAFWDNSLLYEGESIYNYLQVREDEREVVLSTNVLFGVQSVYEKNEGLTGMYYDYALAAPVMAGFSDTGEGGAPSVLILGMGTGTYAAECRKYFSGADITGVEIDRKITDLAVKYFDLPEDIPVYTYDGRAFLEVDDGMYDVIMVDAYRDITIPFQMSSAEFFRLASLHLNPGGVVIVNMNMKTSEPGGINAYLMDTAASVFPSVSYFDVPGNTNRIFFASMEGNGREKLLENASLIASPGLRALAGHVAEGTLDYRRGKRVLTDDRAPVELLGMRAIDGIIREEMDYYRQAFREGGIRALLGAL